jgi:hypothetical protein
MEDLRFSSVAGLVGAGGKKTEECADYETIAIKDRHGAVSDIV